MGGFGSTGTRSFIEIGFFLLIEGAKVGEELGVGVAVGTAVGGAEASIVALESDELETITIMESCLPFAIEARITV